MTDAPTPASTITTVVTHDLQWLKGHVILVAVVAVLVLGSVYGIESLISKHDVANEARDEKLLAVVTSQTTDLKARMTQDEQAAVARDAQYQQIITGLTQTIQKQNSQLQQQIKVNATLTATETAQALAQKTQAAPGTVTAQGDNVTVALPIARILNTDLDKLATTQVQ